jgi:hypothetical protein
VALLARASGLGFVMPFDKQEKPCSIKALLRLY